MQGNPAPREYLLPVTFSSEFSYAPHVVVTVSEMDISNKSTLGWIVRAVDVTSKGFNILNIPSFRSWRNVGMKASSGHLNVPKRIVIAASTFKSCVFC